MPDGIVLVHGGYPGAWCWEAVVRALRRPAVAVDLPGRGARSALDGPVTLDHCVDAVLEDADAAGFERFVLVGHSMGGLTITATANRAPERVSRLVYVAALAPPPGTTVLDLYFPDGGGPPVDDPAGRQDLLDEPAAHALFASDLDADAFAAAHRRCVPEVNGLFLVSLPGYPAGVPTTYVRCTRDAAVPDDLARRMIEQVQPDEVVILDSDHDVMLSHPRELAEVLDGR